MNEDEDLTELFTWLSAVSKAEEEGQHEFTCPLCGGKAEVYRVEHNNHIRAWCNKCGIKVMS